MLHLHGHLDGRATAAIIFLIAGLSAAAPPVSLWAMMTAAGVNMPYVGFFWPLLVPCLLAWPWSPSSCSGWKGERVDIDDVRSPSCPRRRQAWAGGRCCCRSPSSCSWSSSGRQWPHSTPIIGLPLMFAAAAAVTVARVAGAPRQSCGISRDTVAQLLPLLATLTCVGVLVQIMTLTGARGLLAVTVATLPVAVVFATLFVVLPVSEAVLMWGAAPVIGVPLVLLFNTIGLNPIVALAGMSIIWPLGDALPPTAIIGRLTDRRGRLQGDLRPAS